MTTTTMSQLKTSTKTRAVFMVAVGATVLLAAAQRFGIVRESVSESIPATIVLVLAVVGLVHLSRRDTFLPFLGPGVFPPSVLKPSASTPAGATHTATVKVPKGATRVVFWAADPSNAVNPDPFAAYGSFANSGIAEVVDGTAVLSLACPGEYVVRKYMKKKLPRHVHYRAVFPSGLLGPVRTQNLVCNNVSK
jgi:hypothetical protein